MHRITFDIDGEIVGEHVWEPDDDGNANTLFYLKDDERMLPETATSLWPIVIALSLHLCEMEAPDYAQELIFRLTSPMVVVNPQAPSSLVDIDWNEVPTV